MIENIRKVSNPLTIIAIFAAITEIMGTIVVSVNSSEKEILLYFLIGFPTLLVLLFFITLNFNPKVLYSPSDFVDENNYLKVMQINKNAESINTELDRLKKELNDSKNVVSSKNVNDLKKTIEETSNSISKIKANNELLYKGFISANTKTNIENKIFSFLNETSQPQTLSEISNSINIEEKLLKTLIDMMISNKIIKTDVKNTMRAYKI